MLQNPPKTCHLREVHVCNNPGQLAMRPQGLSFSFSLHLTLETDERMISVLIYGLSAALSGVYEGAHFMMKPL